MPDGQSIAQREPTTGPLTTFSQALVRNFAEEVVVFRQLQHLLDHGELTDTELRRELGPMFRASLDGFAIARGFHGAIAELESNGEVDVNALTDQDGAIAAMTGWLTDQQLAADSVIADLVAIEALVGVVEGRELDDGPCTAALESIRSLAYNAIDRLDGARSPDAERPRTPSLTSEGVAP